MKNQESDSIRQYPVVLESIRQYPAVSGSIRQYLAVSCSMVGLYIVSFLILYIVCN